MLHYLAPEGIQFFRVKFVSARVREMKGLALIPQGDLHLPRGDSQLVFHFEKCWL
jgi:hypothetical protein